MFHLLRVASILALLTTVTAEVGRGRAQTLPYPNDPLFSKQWYLHNTGQGGGTPGADIHALEAWSITRCSPNEIIGVLDTGVDSSHGEFAGKLLSGSIFVPGASSPEDGLDHGTGVAGVLAANTDNGVGIAGICPNGRILPVKVANDNGQTDDPEVGLGIEWAVDHGARVINLSLETFDVPQMREGVAYAYAHNVVVVAAAAGPEPFPADYPHVLAVGGSDNKDHALGTPAHATHDLVVAPEQNVVTTSNDGAYTVFCTCVSIAVPMVTGEVALLQSLRPDMTVDQILSAVENGADPIDGQSGFNGNDGWGRVNAYRSLQIAGALPRFFLTAAVTSSRLVAGGKQILKIRSLPGTRLAVRFTYPGGRTSSKAAVVDKSGSFSFTWRPPARAGTITVSIAGTHGFAIKTTTKRFTIL